MAYKFQLGEYTASGSLTQEGAIECDTSLTIGSAAMTEADLEKLDGITNGTAAANKALVLDASSDISGIDALGIASMANNWTNAGRTVADMGIVTTIDINGGSIDGAAIGAAAQSTAKFTTISGSSTLQIGGEATFGGAVNLNGAIINMPSVGAASLDSADFFLSLDSASKDLQARSRANVASDFAGAGLAAASGVLSVGVDDSGIEINSDALRLKDNGVTLAKMAGIARGSIISGDASGDPAALAVGSAHQFLQSDGTDLAYVSMSGDATLAAGVLSIGATKVTDAMLNDDAATGLAGNGLAAASGVMSLDLNELSAVAIASGDFIPLVDASDNSSKKESIDDIATLFAGNGLAASSAVLAVQVSGAVHVASDKVSISGSIAGNGINYAGGVDSISSLTLDADPDSFSVSGLGLQLAANVAGAGIALSTGVLSVDVDELAALGSAAVADSDNFLFSDNGTEKKLAFSNLYGAVFGKVSGDATVAANGALTIAAGAVDNAMMANSAITLTQGAGMAAMGSVSLGASVTVAVDGVLEDLDTLGAASADGEFIVATGAGAFAYESGNTARTSLALGTGSDVTFTSLTLSGDLTVEGTASFRHSDDLIITDKHIMLASGSTSKAASAGGGIALSYTADNSNYFEFAYALNGSGDAVASGDIFQIKDSAAALIDLQAEVVYATTFVGAVVSGVQNVDDAGTLAVGINYWSDLAGAEAATLPASPSKGASVFVKAPSNCSSTNTITINKAGTQLIDGQAAIILESPYAAVQLVAVTAGTGALWRVF